MEQTVITKAQLSISDAGEVEGVSWIFDQPDSVGDRIEPGGITFAKSVPMLMEHDESAVVGIWTSHSEDARQMKVKGQLFLDGIAPARKARERLKSMAVTGLSFKFTSDQYEANSHGGTTYKSVTVSEISLCRLPVHPGARITSVKAEAAERETMEQQEQVAAPDISALTESVKALTEKTGLIAGLETRIKAFETKMNRPAGEQVEEPNEVRKAFDAYIRLGNQAPIEKLKALTVSSDPGGGYLAPPEMSAEFIRDLVEYSPVRSVASVRSTSSPSVIYPKRTGATNAKWKGENQAQEESTIGFGQEEIPVREINTFVDISNQLLADSAGVAETEVRTALSEDFGKKEATAFVNGSGPLQPQGFMVNPDIGFSLNGHATNLSADALITLMYSMPAQYRNAGVWAMNGTTLATIRKLKDGQSNYLWQPSFQVGQPETILGRPVIEMIDMPDVASGAFPIIYGDFSAYRVIDRIGLTILVNPFTRATEGITRYHATRRVGAAVLQPARFKKLKMATS